MQRPRSIRVRYTLRALFVFITLLMLWGGYHANRGWKERAAEDLLRRHGASFAYGPKKSGTGFVSAIEFGYHRVIQLVWRERFITHVTVHSTLDQPEIVDALLALPHLEGLHIQAERHTSLENVELHWQGPYAAKVHLPRGVIDRILAQFELNELGLSLFVLNDDDCRAISRHQTLRGLQLYGSKISETGFADLLRLPGLRGIAFSHCDITGDSLAKLPGSKTLDVIECYGAPVGTEFAAFVGRSPKVTDVRFRYDGIDDDFIAALGPHPSLMALSLAGTRVTDRSIPMLIEMPSLRAVQLPREGVSQASAETLKKARPTLTVQY